MLGALASAASASAGRPGIVRWQRDLGLLDFDVTQGIRNQVVTRRLAVALELAQLLSLGSIECLSRTASLDAPGGMLATARDPKGTKLRDAARDPNGPEGDLDRAARAG